MALHPNVVDITGQTFGRLTVLHPHRDRSRDRHTRWVCECSCGGSAVVAGKDLRSGGTVSCGCYVRQLASERARLRNAREFVTYAGAHARVGYVRGRAADQTCIDCGRAAVEWSYSYRDPDQVTDSECRVYSQDPAFYEPRCKPCHQSQDRHRDPLGRFMSAPPGSPRPEPKTRCSHGHEFTPENTRMDTKGVRRCRECERTNAQRRAAVRKEGPA